VVLRSLKVERQEISRLYEQILNSQKRIYSTDKLDYRTNFHNGILLDENIKQYCMHGTPDLIKEYMKQL